MTKFNATWPTKNAILRGRAERCKIDEMKGKQTDQSWLKELWDFEAKHPVVFAAPSALAEARLIAELEHMKRTRRLRARKTRAKT